MAVNGLMTKRTNLSIDLSTCAWKTMWFEDQQLSPTYEKRAVQRGVHYRLNHWIAGSLSGLIVISRHAERTP